MLLVDAPGLFRIASGYCFQINFSERGVRSYVPLDFVRKSMDARPNPESVTITPNRGAHVLWWFTQVHHYNNEHNYGAQLYLKINEIENVWIRTLKR